ncbi:MAG TPA: RagB/SusD family nutrient uptake outer membrane protein [Prevotella sp.]|nr:RagB/SusD family nutrient uptake outer membrane protein [Prevotella sp.]
MKRQHIISIIVGLMFIAELNSCSESFLDTSSKTDLNTTSFYKTEIQAQYAVTGCYDGYQRTVSNGSWPTLFQAVETMSDDCLGGGGPDDRTDRLMDRMDMSYNSSDVSFMEGIWDDYYKAIYRCNMLLSSINSINWSANTTKKEVEGQARALRGLEYFDMVRLFENIPLLLTATNDIVPQAAPDSVYAQIVSDLKYAADSIPAGSFVDKNTNLGRITKYAAGAMLARVYLFYDGVYNSNKGGIVPGGLTKAEALQYCEDCISSGNYSLEAEFKNLWPAASTEATSPAEGQKTTYNEASNEIVWVVKFNNDQNWTNTLVDGNRFMANFGLRNTTAFAPYGNGWGACPITPYASGLFLGTDTRGSATIINCRNIGAYNVQIATDCMDYTGYANKKYCPLIYTDGSSMPASQTTVDGGNMQTSQDQNWILMRYSDVLLMAAELGSPNSMKYFNMVRERAYGGTTNDINSAPTTQQIWNERRKEFMGEGLRYWDLRRQGLDAFVKAELGQATSDGTVTGTAVSVYNNRTAATIASTYVDANIRQKRGFLQIPYNQITLSNGVYKQNAGW